MVGKVNVKNISRKPYLFRIAHQVMNLTRPGGEDAFYFLLAYYKGRKNVGDKELFEKLKLEALDKFPNDKRFNRFNY